MEFICHPERSEGSSRPNRSILRRFAPQNDIFKNLAVVLVQLISAFFRALGWRACRYAPSCSSYAVEAFRTLPFFTALRLSLRRILSCHPFSAGGYDPLPKIVGTRSPRPWRGNLAPTMMGFPPVRN